MSIVNNRVHKNILDTMQNLEEIGGVKDTEEYVEIMRALISECFKRISIAVNSSDGPRMSDATREEVIDFLKDVIRDTSFGDGLEGEYIMDGTVFEGLNNNTDLELLSQLLCYTGDDEELVLKVKSELAVEEMLSNKEG